MYAVSNPPLARYCTFGIRRKPLLHINIIRDFKIHFLTTRISCLFCLSFRFVSPFFFRLCFSLKFASEDYNGEKLISGDPCICLTDVRRYLSGIAESKVKEAFLFTVLLCSRSLGHRESKDGRADLARGNQICVKLSDLFLSLSLFPSPPPLLFSSNSFTVEITISIDRDREIFLFLLYRGMIVCYTI